MATTVRRYTLRGQESLASKIRRLCDANPDTNNAGIAKLARCPTTYVRVIRNQRKATAFSAHDAAYLLRKHSVSDLTEARRLERAEMRARVAAR